MAVCHECLLGSSPTERGSKPLWIQCLMPQVPLLKNRVRVLVCLNQLKDVD